MQEKTVKPFKIEGRYNKAKVFSIKKDDSALNQIKSICNNPAYKDSKIRIMPDYHKGKGSVIGFTATINNRVVPNAVGVDINCGMHTTRLGKIDIDLSKLDDFIYNNIPSGFKKNKHISKNIDSELKNKIKKISNKMNLDYKKQLKGIGSLGGGNHFIEINISGEGIKYLVVHSGSRNFGLQVCNYHQKKAINYCKNKSTNKANSYLEDKLAEDYYQDMKIAQRYADANRREITRRILNYLGIDIKKVDSFQTRHNYIDFDDMIIRKGAISAHKGEKILIPLNMRDGSILAKGKGNKDWNYSAPHGAGRVMSRRKAKRSISLADYKKSMKNVYSTSVNKGTLDEAPFAYKSAEGIIMAVKQAVNVIEVLKPIYNFKAS